MKKIFILFLGLTTIGLTACKKKGCTHNIASNYSDKAIKDDGSCKYFKKVRVESISVSDIPANNGGSFWDNSVFTAQQAPDPYIALTEANGNVLSNSNGFDNTLASTDNKLTFKLTNDNLWLTDFTATYNVILLDDDQLDSGETSAYDIIGNKALNLVELTDKNSSNKFPSSVSYNQGGVVMKISLKWAE